MPARASTEATRYGPDEIGFSPYAPAASSAAGTGLLEGSAITNGKSRAGVVSVKVIVRSSGVAIEPRPSLSAVSSW